MLEAGRARGPLGEARPLEPARFRLLVGETARDDESTSGCGATEDTSAARPGERTSEELPEMGGCGGGRVVLEEVFLE